VKTETINKYPAFKRHFAKLERQIQDDPFSAAKEEALFNGKRLSVYKRNLRTEFFSGMLPDRYMYITALYALSADDRIVVINAFLHDYPV
jgi:hypothetical protein